MASDAHLVGLIRQGRSVAFEAAYDRHHRAILSFCRHMLGSAEEAEDALQQTFLSAYNDLISSDKPIHLRAWLFTIARNRCYSILRSRREQPVGELDDTATEGLAAQVQRRQDLRDLVQDLQRLPEDQRAALVLAEMDALSHDQIATVLGVPREKVKALVFQARESLIASRAARETDCSEIREQLANLSGGALRRGNLRRHLRECSGCRDFRHQIERQRRQLRVVLPVAPTLALKETVLATTVGGGAAGLGAATTAGGIGAAATATGSGGAVATSLLKGGLMKGLVGATLASVGTAGTLVAVHDLQSGVSSHRSHLRSLVGKAPFSPVPARAASHGGSAASRAAATTASASYAGSRSSASTAQHAYVYSGSGATAAVGARHAATKGGAAGRAAAETRIAVLNPLSKSGLAGTKISNPLAPKRVASVPAAPASPSSGAGNHASHSASSPYLGASAFGNGPQNAGGGSRASGSQSSQSSGSSSQVSTGSTGSAGTSSSGYTVPSGSGTTHTSTGSSGSSSASTTTHSGGGRSSVTASGSGTSPTVGTHSTSPTGTTSTTGSRGTTSTTGSSTTSTPTTTASTPPATTTSAPAPTDPTTTDPTSTDPGGSSGDSGSGYGGGTDTGPHGR